MKPMIAAMRCSTEDPAIVGSGNRATPKLETAAIPMSTRPGQPMPVANVAVVAWQSEVSMKITVMKTRVGASPAASSLIVCTTGLKSGDISSAVTVPPMKMIGASVAEIRAGRRRKRDTEVRLA